MNRPRNEKLKQAEAAEYNSLVNQINPRPAYFKNGVWAFAIGGLICMIGQIIMNALVKNGMELKNAGSLTSVSLIFLAALFTGWGFYDELAKRAGAGTIVPITGFANAVVSPALEFQHEGFVLGTAAQMFSIAGPVLVYGVTTSVLYGLILFVFHLY